MTGNGSIPEGASGAGWFTRLGERLGRAWRWIRRKHEPISEGIETAGRGWTRTARTAARVGRSLAKIGRLAERNGAALARGRGKARRIGRNIAAFGAGLRRLGEGMARTGRNWAPVGENIEDIGEHLGSLDISPLPPVDSAARLAPPPARGPAPLLPAEEVAAGSQPASPPPPSEEPPGGSESAPAPPRPRSRPQAEAESAPAPLPREEPPAGSESPSPPVVSAPSDELPAEVRTLIAGLGRRPRSNRLRPAIEAICRSREWTTISELSRFLGVSAKTLRGRHLPAMVREGRLILRDPNRGHRRSQAYGAPPASS